MQQMSQKRPLPPAFPGPLSQYIPVLAGADGVLICLRKLRIALRDRPLKDVDDDEEASATTSATTSGQRSDPAVPGKAGSRKRRRPNEPWKPFAKEGAIAVGFNEVSRLLEQDEHEQEHEQGGQEGQAGSAVGVVLVCRATRPAALLDPIFALCRRRGCPCVMVPCTSAELGQALGMGRCIALAIRRRPKPKHAHGRGGEEESEAALGKAAVAKAAAEFIRSVCALPHDAGRSTKKKKKKNK